MKQTENGFSQHMYRTGCTPIFVQFGQILVRKFHNHISCLFFNFQNKEMSHTELQIWIINKIFVFLQHSGLSILLGQLTMFLVFWSFKFIDKLEILCEGQSVFKIFDWKLWIYTKTGRADAAVILRTCVSITGSVASMVWTSVHRLVCPSVCP